MPHNYQYEAIYLLLQRLFPTMYAVRSLRFRFGADRIFKCELGISFHCGKIEYIVSTI